jgi:ABC-type sugar transport system ATPase subunit
MVRGLEKRYGGVHALRGVDLDVAARNVHGIVGPNGSGKSTLVKSIVGLVRPDAGQIILNGVPLALRDAAEARSHRIAVVPQELAIVPEMTVAENIALGAEEHIGGLLRKSVAKRRAAQALAQISDSISIDALGSDLRPSQQRIVMIAAALFRDSQLVIMDEPTAGMELREADEVLAVVQGLTRRDVTVIYVSHRLDEILQVCDQVSLFRDGECVATLSKSAMSKAALTEAVIAGTVTLAEKGPGLRRENLGTVPALVACRGLVGKFLRGADFATPPGEVVGVIGTAESGVTELLEMLAGLVKSEQGEIEIGGRVVSIRSPVAALRHRIGYLAAGRSQAAISDLPVRENISLSNPSRVSRVLITPWSERRAVAPIAAEVGVVRRFDDDISTLSGGNQQKALLARLLFADVRVALLDDPTLGVDVGGRRDLLGALRAFADEGNSVIVHSSEPAELIGTADRICAFRGGRVVNELRGGEINEAALASAIAGFG